MKKNLLVLFGLLVLIAVTAQITRKPGEDPELTSLRLDAIHCLDALWPGDAAQNVEIGYSPEGLILIANVHIPLEVAPMRKCWTYDVLGMVTQRHPQTRVVEVRVVDRGKGLPRNLEGVDPQELTLLRRQRQAEIDQVMPLGKALVLLDAEFAPAPIGRIEFEQRIRTQDDGPSARRALYQPPMVPIRTTVWLVLAQDPPAGLLEKIKPDRVVRLPVI